MINTMTMSNQQEGIWEWIGLGVLVLALPYLSVYLGASSIDS
jgi:hypothetical protein